MLETPRRLRIYRFDKTDWDIMPRRSDDTSDSLDPNVENGNWHPDAQFKLTPKYHPTICRHCQHEALREIHRISSLYRDEPEVIGPRQWIPVAFMVERRRYLCRHCNRTQSERPSLLDARRQMTRYLVRFVERHVLSPTLGFAEIARGTGLEDRAIEAIFKDLIQRLDARRRIVTPEWLVPYE